MKDAKSVGILRTHTQVENTEMLTDCYRIIKIYTKMKHQTIPVEEVIQVSSWRNREKARDWSSGSRPGVCLPPVDSSPRIVQLKNEWEKYQGGRICRF